MARFLSEEELASSVGRRQGDIRRAVERGLISADTRAEGLSYFRVERLEELRAILAGPGSREGKESSR